METRKVQLTGGSTYTVSLPKQWAGEHGIEAGSRLHLHPGDDGSIVVRAARDGGQRRECERSVDGLDPTDAVRLVEALYIAGLDEFALTGRALDADARRAMARAADGLVGLEPVEESEGRVGFRSLLDAGDVSIRQTVIQLQLTALSMHREAVRALVEGDGERAGHVIERDDEADRLFGMVNRHFQRSLTDLREVERLGLDRPTVFDYYATARQLERVADHAEKVAGIAERIEDPPAGTVDRIADLARRADAVVEDAASVLLGDGDTDTAYAALRDRDTLLEAVDALDRKLYTGDGEDAYLLGVVLDSVTRTAEYGGNIAEVALRAAAREDGDEDGVGAGTEP